MSDPARADPLLRLGGRAPAIEALREQIRRLAGFDAVDAAMAPTLLISGETGTGKGLVARIVHDSGPRARGPFVAVNCAAIPETMLEAELFGYEAGAFTDARRAKPGLFEAGAQGTLFLDEIDSLSMSLQGKLLTAIESKRVRRLGAVAEHAVNVKLIAATQRDLRHLAATGSFRPDLYHRLAVVVLGLPPLRERGDDVVELAHAMLARFASGYGAAARPLTAEAAAWLTHQPWPGNVRELGHLMERVTLLHPGPAIDAAVLARLAAPGRRPPPRDAEVAPPDGPGSDGDVDEASRIRSALARTGGNVVRAARLLGMSRDTIRYRMRRLGLGRPDLEAPAEEAMPAAAPAPAAAGARDREDPDPATATWEQKPVAIVAIELVWPTPSAGRPVGFEPWTEAARWDRATREKLEGLGGVLLSTAPSLVIWAFGIPRTLEELVPRAVHGALAIRSLATRASAAAAGPDVRIAVHVGAMLVDATAARPETAALPMGTTLSRPMELLADAEVGEVIASHEIVSALDGWVHAEPLPGAKGDAAGAGCHHRLLGLVAPAERARASRPLTPFVGRQRELDTVLALSLDVTRGAGAAIGVIGEPGIGKSRLLHELGQRLLPRGIRYLEAHCRAAGTMTPYLLLAEAVSLAIGLTGTEETEAVRDAVAARLGLLGLDDERHLPYLSAAIVGEHPPELAGARDVKARILEAARELLLAEARHRPMVLAVENAHWIDPTSDEWLADLADHLAAAHLCLVVTYRPGYRPSWIDRGHATQIGLRPLGPAESEQLVRAASGAARIPAPAETHILERGEGNPFFLEELVRGLGSAADGARDWHVPDTVRAVLAARMDRLSPGDRRLLQTAAVIGREVPRAVLERVAEGGDEALLAGLDRLQAAEFLFEKRARGGPAYVFAHALTQAAAYDALPGARRRAIHRSAAAALEALGGAGRPEWLQALAEHAAKAEEWPRALEYFRRAADAATARQARREAVRGHEAALQALSHLPEDGAALAARAEIHLRLAESRYALGEFGRAREELAQSRALSERAGDGEAEARALLGLLHVATAEGGHQEAIAAGERVLAIGRTLDSAPVRIWAGLGLTRVAFAAGQYRRGVDYGRAAVEALAAEPDDGPAATHWMLRSAPAARTYMALCLARTGDFDEGARHAEDAMRLADSSGSPIDRAWAHYGLARVHHARTAFDRAIPLLEQGLALLGADPSPVFFTRTLAGLASAYAQSGRVAEALPLLERALAVAEAVRFEQGRSLVVVQLGETRLAAGRVADAAQSAREAIEMARGCGERGNEAWALHLCGAAAHRAAARSAGAARERYGLAWRLAEQLEMRPLVARSRLSLGEVELEEARPAEAREHLEAAAALCGDMGIAAWLADARRGLARLAGEDARVEGAAGNAAAS